MSGKKRALIMPAISIGDHALNCEAIPDHTLENMARVIFREVREYFSNPAVQEDYQIWLLEYRKNHPTKGGETC